VKPPLIRHAVNDIRTKKSMATTEKIIVPLKPRRKLLSFEEFVGQVNEPDKAMRAGAATSKRATPR
jgi:hypothetical protein